jgi:hypothetical protein
MKEVTPCKPTDVPCDACHVIAGIDCFDTGLYGPGRRLVDGDLAHEVRIVNARAGTYRRKIEALEAELATALPQLEAARQALARSVLPVAALLAVLPPFSAGCTIAGCLLPATYWHVGPASDINPQLELVLTCGVHSTIDSLPLQVCDVT